MKKLISLLLCVSMIISAFPAVFAAPVLDTAEKSEEQVTEKTEDAELSAAYDVEIDIPGYDSVLGELVYYENFEDGKTGDAFGNGEYAYIWSAMTIVDDPAGEKGKVAISNASITTAEVTSPKVTHFDEVTVMADLYMPASKTSASGWMRISYNDAKCDWSTYKITEAEKWFTVSETVTDIGTKDGMWIYEISGNGIYLDNIRVYAKYDLGNKVRLVDGYNVNTYDAESGYVLPAPAASDCNAWKTDDGKVYYPGETIPAGMTVVAFKEPVYYDKTLGELIYFEDFEDGSQANSYTPIGSSAYIWTAGNVVDNPAGSGKVFVSTVDYTQLIVNGDYSLDTTEVTFCVDFLNYDSVAANIPVCFLDSWLNPWDYWTNNQISKTEWTTKTVTKTQNITATQANVRFYFGGKGMYVDNVRIYAHYDIGNNVRLVEAKPVLHELTGDTFTFPEFSGMKNVWVDEDGNEYKPGDVINVSDCKGKTYIAELVAYEETAKLSVSASEITEDRGTVTVTPEISYVTGVSETDFSGITYVTDTANAAIERNADDSLTVTGQMNGDITIKALLPDEISEKLENNNEYLETTITVSGQAERIVGTSIKVMMFGNSIRKHAPNESLKWYGNWGMAASAEDKDYAHRFVHYMEEKYGDGTVVLYDTLSVKEFEDAFANKDASADYTSAISSYINQIEEAKPHIVTLQFGDNAKNVTSADAYANGVKQFVKAIKDVSPDTVVVISTPFFGGSHHVTGTVAAGEELGIPVALLHKLYTAENQAKSEYPAGTLVSGVDIHPGDTGMDNIAKEFFALVNPIISENLKVEYTTIPASVVIENESLAITGENGTLALSAAVLPQDASQEVAWSLVSENAENYASITADGVLTALNNGTVTVRATSKFKNDVYAEAEIVISGQADPFTVTFDGNADDATVPEPNTMAKKGFSLTNVDEFASRPGYKFLGWSLTSDGDVVDALYEAETDTTVYAKWALAEEWFFETEGYAEDFTFENAFHQKVTGGDLSVTATGSSASNVMKIVSPVLKLDAADYYAFYVRMMNTEKSGSDAVKLTVNTNSGSHEVTATVSSTDYADYYFDISGISGQITGFTLVPTDVDCTVNIAELGFAKHGSAKYTEKPAEYSESYGKLVYFDNFSGEDFGNTADILVLGPGSTSVDIAGKKAKANDYKTLANISLSGIIIKAADGETFKYTDGRAMDGTFTLVFEMYNSTAKTYSYYHVVDTNPGGWDSWSGYYTAWSSKKTAPGTWTAHTGSISSTDKGAFGYLNSNQLETKVSIASVALYFKPKNAVTLIDGDTTSVIDLSGLDTFTFPESENTENKGWTTSDGTEHLALETVSVSSLIGMTFTSCEANTGKVTYDGVSYEYVRLDGASTSYVVRDDNYPEWDIGTDGSARVCIGWSTEENSDTALKIVNLTNAGITLYPVWEITAEAVDYEIAVDGENAIEIDNTDITYTYKAVFTPGIEYDTVTWSVSDESVAAIDQNGVLTPIKDGSVTVTAKADYYPGKTASIDVEISYKEGYEPVNVSFEGDVETLPESFKIIPGKLIDLGTYLDMTATDSTKRFNGWILNGDSSTVYTDSIEALSGKDMVFTAVVNYDFNFAVPQSLKGYYNHGTWVQKDNMLVCTPNYKGDDTHINLSGLSIPASRFEAVEFYMDVNYTNDNEAKTFEAGTAINQFYFSTPSASNRGPLAGNVSAITEDGKYAVITIDLNDSRWTDTVTVIRNDFAGNGYYGYNIRYIRFVEKPQMVETELTISDITVPVTGFTPDTSAKAAEKFAGIESVTWSCDANDSFLASGNFNEKTAYTVTVKVICTDKNEIFNDKLTATINGNEAAVNFASDGSALISYTFDATNAFVEFDAEISGKDVITKAGRSIAYSFVVSNPEVPDMTASWSIDNTDIAVMSAEGKLAAKRNGTLTITAVSNYNPNVSASFDVTIEGLEEKYIALTFDKGTDDEVTGMPENVTVQTGEIDIPAEVPVRDGYIFLGWTESEDSFDVIETLTANEDTTLYALWGSGILWDFNGTKEGFAVDNGTLTTADTYVSAKTAGSNDIRLYSPALELDPARYNKVMIKLAVETAGVVDVFYSTDGSGISSGKRKTLNYTGSSLTDWQTLTFDFSSVGQYTSADKITKFWIDPFQATNTTAYIDYIFILDNNKTITFNANGGTLPEAYINGITKAEGTTLSLSEEAVLEGCNFLGWSKTPDGKELITSLTVRDNVTLYAIYGEKVDSETESIVLEENEVLLVKSSKNSGVTISYVTPDGAKTWNGKTNANGYAIAELETGIELTDIVLTPASASATVSDSAVAAEIANAVTKKPNTTSKNDGDSSFVKAEYDMTVEILTKPGTIFPEGYGDDKSVASDFAKGTPIVFGFDEDYQKNLFTEVAALEKGYEPESVLSFRIFSKNVDASVTPELTIKDLSLDTDEIKYIVIRARTLGFENPTLRLYFTDDDTTSYTKLASVFNTLTDEYSVYVYNMSANKNWNGTVDSIKLAAENNTSGSLDIDWIMFTDEIPEDTTELDKAYDIFGVVVHDDMPFTDVKKNKWSYTEIKQSFKRGFVNGKSETIYAPEDNVTVAEAVTIAVRLNHIFNGKAAVENAQDGNWYDTYVEAAIKAKIIGMKQFDNFDRPATRREVAMIMENAVPSYYLEEINMFDSLPDVEEGSTGANQILKLYSAGVLNGTDAIFSFLPENNITREELAAIVNRIALPSARRRLYTEAERLANRKVYEGAVLGGISLWSCTENTLKVGSDGIARATSNSEEKDPIALLQTITGRFNGKDVQKIRMGLVWDKENVTLTPEIYYTTTSSGSFTWQKRFEGKIGETDENGITEVVFDVTTQSAFQDTVTQLRFDPFDLSDTEFGIAYLILE